MRSVKSPVVTAPADPSHPLSPGVHIITDGGTRYVAGDGPVDLLMGRSVDVAGRVFALPGGWPSLLIELNMQMPEVQPRAGYDHVPDILASRGLTPTADLLRPPGGDTIRFAVRRRPCDDRDCDCGSGPGVYGPGPAPDKMWTVMAPLPPWPDAVDELIAERGGRMALYLTTRTVGLVYAGGQAMLAGMRAEAAAGMLFGARAAVM